MKKTKFTPEQVTELRQVPYTLAVTECTIRFTDAFKKDFWKLYIQGKTPAAIFRELGYNTDILGPSRISNFAYKQVQKHLDADNQTSDQKFKNLESQIAALKCELNSLKKIMLMANSPSSEGSL